MTLAEYPSLKNSRPSSEKKNIGSRHAPLNHFGSRYRKTYRSLNVLRRIDLSARSVVPNGEADSCVATPGEIRCGFSALITCPIVSPTEKLSTLRRCATSGERYFWNASSVFRYMSRPCG